MDSLFMASTSFGNHTLHHLFPTVDHSKLPLLLPAFLETCEEFGVKFEVSTPWQLFKGFFQSLLANEANTNIPANFFKTKQA